MCPVVVSHVSHIRDRWDTSPVRPRPGCGLGATVQAKSPLTKVIDMAQLPPAGWHPDPMGRHAQRYWDGQQWTDHVADVAGNMTTDPLSGSSGQGQTQQAADQQRAGQQQAAAGRATTPEATGQASQQQAGQQQAVSGGPATSATADTGTQATDTPKWDGTSGADTADTGTGTAEAAGGTAAAAWGASSTTDTAPASADDSTRDSPGAAHATTAGDDLDTSTTGDDPEATAGTVISSAGLVAIAVDEDGVLTNRTAVVARQDSVATSDEEAGHRLHGNGTAWLGGRGRHVAVIEVTGAGLVVGTDQLVAHSAGLTSEDAHSGIAGFEATRLSGTGWVAIAAAGGIAEVSTVGGATVAEGSLVGHTADLDVAHGDHVQLSGHGVALVSPGA